MNPLLARMHARQHGRCHYCGAETWLCGAREPAREAMARFGITPDLPWSKLWLDWRKATREHLIAKAMGGGPHAKANQVMACRACNLAPDPRVTPEAHLIAMRALAAAGRHPCHPGLEARVSRHLAAAPGADILAPVTHQDEAA